MMPASHPPPDPLRMPPRFFVDLPLAAHATLALPDAVARHVQVLRLQAGDAIALFNGTGGEWRATLTEIGKRHATAQVGDFDPREAETPYRIVLAQGIAGGDKMDWLLEKAVELGVTEIQPLLTERAVVRLAGERADKRVAHWRALAEAACEQCGRNRVPTVAPIVNFRQWLGALSSSPRDRVLLSPRAETRLTDWATSRRAAIGTGGILLLVGPEGGLAEAEERDAEQAGFTPVLLGPRILRTETAGLATLAALHAALGEF
jgi:16S rRNA (uracil1498-N3)-methyltransferase